MQKVVGSSPIIRFARNPLQQRGSLAPAAVVESPGASRESGSSQERPRGLVICALSVLALAASSAAGKSTTAKIRLEVAYYGYDSSSDSEFTRVAYLECAPPGGDVENPTAACHALWRDYEFRTRRIVYDIGLGSCGMGPAWSVGVVGVYRGHPVDVGISCKGRLRAYLLQITGLVKPNEFPWPGTDPPASGGRSS
jgi:hypothetical protein